MIDAQILADSINTKTGDRLTTFRVRIPKWLLAEINTHRALSRNFASSRAIPSKKIREQVIQDPVIPVWWGVNQKGMQAESELSGLRLWAAKKSWMWARYPAVIFHWLGERLGLHKQIINRILEPWMWADGIISATEWRNFFKLRTDAAAQPEFKKLADAMKSCYDVSDPRKLKPPEWHVPLVSFNADPATDVIQISAARCAKVSYLLRERSSNWDEDLKLHDRLANSGHWSPFEHQAYALPNSERNGNFVGWMQYRKQFESESGGDYECDAQNSTA